MGNRGRSSVFLGEQDWGHMTTYVPDDVIQPHASQALLEALRASETSTVLSCEVRGTDEKYLTHYE